MCAIPSTGDGSMAGGSNTGTLRNGEPQASARGGRIGTLPTKNFACFVAAHRPADHHLQALAVDLLDVLRGRDHGRERRHLELRVAALDLERGERRHVAQQRREMVALNVGNMIGLGGGEQHLVDVRTEQQLGEDAAVTVAEALQNGVEREPRVVEGVAARQQRAQHVDQHDLARVMPEVVLVERRHRLALVDFEALRHQRAERVRGERVDGLGDVERREPQIRHVAERPRHRKRPGCRKLRPWRSRAASR